MNSGNLEWTGQRISGAKKSGARSISARSGVLYRACLPVCLLFLSLAGCGTGEMRPVELLREDVCANCKMAISQRAFAAEILDSEQTAVKFDDIGCLVRYASKPENKGKIAAWFVMDYASRTWTDASKAWYVRNSAIRTPMGSGIVAYREKSQAESAATQAGVKVQTFFEIFP